jgi:hypothetical protein
MKIHLTFSCKNYGVQMIKSITPARNSAGSAFTTLKKLFVMFPLSISVFAVSVQAAEFDPEQFRLKASNLWGEDVLTGQYHRVREEAINRDM